nr:ribonuclease H-like domain-containing protein [Tanacetum cinerariifolium]
MIITGVVLCKQKIANPTWYGHVEPIVNNTIEKNFDPVISRINLGLHMFLKRLNEEMVADLRYFNSLESEVDSLTSQLETQKTQFMNEIDRLSREYFYVNHMNAILGVYTELDEVTNLQYCQIVDNYKKGLGYESYNAVPPPYIGNFMPPKPDLSYTGLDEFAVKHVVENKSSKEETKAVRKNTDAPIIKEWVSDDEEKNGNPQIDLQDKGVIDSGCSWHITRNMSYLTDYEEIDRGYVAFGGNPKGGKITEKDTIKTGKLDFENVYFVLGYKRLHKDKIKITTAIGHHHKENSKCAASIKSYCCQFKLMLLEEEVTTA